MTYLCTTSKISSYIYEKRRSCLISKCSSSGLSAKETYIYISKKRTHNQVCLKCRHSRQNLKTHKITILWPKIEFMVDISCYWEREKLRNVSRRFLQLPSLWDDGPCAAWHCLWLAAELAVGQWHDCRHHALLTTAEKPRNKWCNDSWRRTTSHYTKVSCWDSYS